ncbi:GPO family capsid scaffolding protein [Chitinivorax sp. B]|uniref:GPO family capsid scaffolding protein n=1 Tax=Chitinivorax sp. B TaxID=2502235 RepID=UPI0010F64311|nr:GPO family capsid scaffolding protein [Chitinivorax sp. B]
MAGKSKQFRIATEGATTDGRVIERQWLTQMAANYDPKTYGARVNLEHIKGFTPDSPFKRYGDVLSLSTQEDADGKLALYAVIDPTDELIAMTKARQKVYTSMEVRTDFADTGEAYLVGLAVTDDPASLGTEMLQFSATAKHNPLASRKSHPDNLFSEAVAFQLELDTADSQGLLDSFSSKIKALLKGNQQANDQQFDDLQSAVEVIADSQREVLADFTSLQATRQELTTLQAQFKQLSADHAALVQQLSQQPSQPSRPRTAGGGGPAHETDC